MTSADLTDAQLWQMRSAGRKTLGRSHAQTVCASARLGRSHIRRTPTPYSMKTTLTLGFARRFATYKRPNLLLHDPERLVRLLSDPQRPVQLILAGKAHPQDLPGQALIQQWNDFIQRPEIRGRVVFLSDYDMLLAQELVQGVDLWINTPRRPWEACGTSGMKVLVNGGLNLSELDGWWAEAYSPEVGWAIGDGKEHGEDPAWDADGGRIALFTAGDVRSSRSFMSAIEGGCRRSGWDASAKAWRGSLRNSPPAVPSANTPRITIFLPLPVIVTVQPRRERLATA